MPRAPRIEFGGIDIPGTLFAGALASEPNTGHSWLVGPADGDADPGRHVGMHLLDWPTDEYGSSSAEAVATT